MALFRFEARDVIFIGRGSLATAALAGLDGATAVMLEGDSSIWRPLLRESGVSPEAVFYDQGTSENRDLLCRLAEEGPRRAFLAGDFPRSSGFRPKRSQFAAHALRGASPRQLQVTALEGFCKEAGMSCGSLYDVLVETETATSSIRRPDRPLDANLEAARSEFLEWLFELRELKRQPSPDPVARSRDTALVSWALPDGTGLILRRWRDGYFETAFVDEDLVRRYADAGNRRLLLERNVLVLEPERVAGLCRERGLDLLDLGR